MPRCDGRPEGPCRLNKIDSSVHHSQGDLMLCDECERHRFPYIYRRRRQRMTEMVLTTTAVRLVIVNCCAFYSKSRSV